MFSAVLLAASALVAADPGGRDYDRCIAAVEADAEAGRDYAEAWIAEGGLHDARHCAAMAMVALDKGTSAGAVLADLAELERRDPGVATTLFLQSAEAFMSGGDRDRAFAALRQAYDLAQDTPELHMTAAMVYATAEEWRGTRLAIDALSRHGALSADAYLLRAQAHDGLGEAEAAARDVGRALTLNPYLVDALVLRGDLIVRGHPIPDDPILAQR